jgi:hypothetical protein
MTISEAHEYDQIDREPALYGQGIYHYRNIVLTEMIKGAGLEPVNAFELACSYGFLAQMILEECSVSRYVCSNFSKQVFDYTEKQLNVDKDIRVIVKLINANDVAFKHSVSYPPISRNFIIICTSLEHLENDRKIIKSFPEGVHFFFSVPDFPAKTHFRFFRNEDEIYQRYEDLLRVIECIQVQVGHIKKYVIHSIKK